jgi:hypothetical protein
MALDVAGLTALVFARLRTDVAGAGVRAALGTYKDENGVEHPGIIYTWQLPRYRPARPFAALRSRPLIERADRSHAAAFDWFLYDDPAQGYARINSLVPLIVTAYTAPRLFLAAGGAINQVEITDVGQETDDRSLGLLLRVLAVAVYL